MTITDAIVWLEAHSSSSQLLASQYHLACKVTIFVS